MPPVPQTVLLRLAAFLVDALVLSLALIIPSTLISYTGLIAFGATRFFVLVWYVALLVFIAGILLRDGSHGRSVGKRILGLLIQTPDGKPCSYPRSVLRNLPSVVPLWNLAELGLMLSGRTRTGDRLARTSVVDE